ncbi:MAG: hypothetical protein ACXVZ4_07475 [Gaiellaceae bacterium]
MGYRLDMWRLQRSQSRTLHQVEKELIAGADRPDDDAVRAYVDAVLASDHASDALTTIPYSPRSEPVSPDAVVAAHMLKQQDVALALCESRHLLFVDDAVVRALVRDHDADPEELGGWGELVRSLVVYLHTVATVDITDGKLAVKRYAAGF